MADVSSSLPPQKYVVFLRDSVDIERPLEVVRQHLCADANWLVPIADQVADDAMALNLRLAPSSAGRRFGVPARVRLDRPSEHDGTVLIPIRWEATTLSGLFPVLDGNMELRTLGTDACRLGLSASYRPPLDIVGEWLDRVAFHRVAESTVRSFLALVASRLNGGEQPLKVQGAAAEGRGSGGGRSRERRRKVHG